MLEVLKIALGEVGYHEGEGNFNKYAAYLDGLDGFYNGRKNGYAWCDVFVDYCFVKAYGRETAQKLLCQPDNSAGAGCTYSAQYYQRAGQWSKNPQIGAQIFFGDETESYHTGLVCAVDTEKVYTVEGNSSDTVARREYPRNHAGIYGYGLPNFSLVGETTGESEADKPDYSGSYLDEGENDEVVHATRWVGTSTAAITKNCAVTLPELKEGAKGESVRAMQHLLIVRGFSVGNYGPDGDFGVDTLQAVKSCQTENELEADGVCGARTWSRLIGGRGK